MKRVLTIITGLLVVFSVSGSIFAADTTSDVIKQNSWFMIGAHAKFDKGWGFIAKYSTRNNLRTISKSPKADEFVNKTSSGNFLQEFFIGPSKSIKLGRGKGLGLAFLYRPIWKADSAFVGNQVRRDTIHWVNTFGYNLKSVKVSFRFIPWILLPHRLDSPDGKRKGDYENLDFITRYMVRFSFPLMGNKFKSLTLGTAFEVFLNHTGNDADKAKNLKAEETFSRYRIYADLTMKAAPSIFKLAYIYEGSKYPSGKDINLTQHYIVVQAMHCIDFSSEARKEDSALKKAVEKK